jgi:acetyl esterase/lipase
MSHTRSFRLLPRLVAILLGLLVTSINLAAADEPKPELLWPHGAPGAKGDTPADRPTLTAYLPEPDKAVGTAVVICPGGAYAGLATDHEGRQFARWFNSFGVAAFVLEYRHRGRGYGHPAPLQDAQRAIRTVRAGADRWHVAPNRIGIIGFSAGGHLASTVGTHYDRGNPVASDPIERISCRPDFLVLCYAVIAFGEPYAHSHSQQNLIGPNADAALVRSLSNEKQVTAATPPTFLFHTDEDKGVPPEHSVRFYLALQRAGVPAEMHIYRTGPHGVGLAANVPGTRTWPDRLKDWMQGQRLLDSRK